MVSYCSDPWARPVGTHGRRSGPEGISSLFPPGKGSVKSLGARNRLGGGNPKSKARKPTQIRRHERTQRRNAGKRTSSLPIRTREASKSRCFSLALQALSG